MAAKEVVRRHQVLRDFLVKVLSVDDTQANEAACRMEHAIPQAVLERIVKFVQFVEKCPRGGARWIKGFGYHCEDHTSVEDCKRCISSCLNDVERGTGTAIESKRMILPLKELAPGQKGKVERIAGQGEVYKRLIDMGITPGSLIEMRRVAPLGDPIEIKVRGYNLSLRKQEADKISIELI
jgi:DtxR family Mn-dependent transcriptional regulator